VWLLHAGAVAEIVAAAAVTGRNVAEVRAGTEIQAGTGRRGAMTLHATMSLVSRRYLLDLINAKQTTMGKLLLELLMAAALDQAPRPLPRCLLRRFLVGTTLQRRAAGTEAVPCLLPGRRLLPQKQQQRRLPRRQQQQLWTRPLRSGSGGLPRSRLPSSLPSQQQQQQQQLAPTQVMQVREQWQVGVALLHPLGTLPRHRWC
jgi:hypothetical protein